MKGRFIRGFLRVLDSISRAGGGNSHPNESTPHLLTGQLGEEAAYFYLREQGYVVVARNYRSPHHKGEIDLIAWDGDALCFVEVKTRRKRTFVPAEAAVNAQKQAMLRSTARTYLRKLKQSPPVRFDIVSLYRESETGAPDITLFKNAFPMS